MREYVAKGYRGALPQSLAEVQTILREACMVRLQEMDALGANTRMPEIRNGLERFIAVLDSRGPALQSAPCRMHPKPAVPGMTCTDSGSLSRRVGGGWAVPPPPEPASRRVVGCSEAVARSVERLADFVHNPSACLSDERRKRSATHTLCQVFADGVEVKMHLQRIARHRPYLLNTSHPLFHWVQLCHASLESGDVPGAHDHLQRMEAALRTDEKRLKAAFAKFDHDGSGELSVSEFRHFAVYVGFGTHAVDAVMRAGDLDADGSISLAEFSDFVGRMGGVHALFEQRRKKLEATGDHVFMETGSRVRAHFHTLGGISGAVYDGRVLSVSRDGLKVVVKFDMGQFHFTQEVPRDWIEQDIDVMESLQEIGILDDAQHYWTMILPASEQHVVKSLSSCQRTAIDHVRTMALHNHSKAMPELMARTQSIGINEEQLSSMLTWIRDCAPIIVHVRLDSVGPFLESDTHYRNQFETNSSNGHLCAATRTDWERKLFGSSYDGALPRERPKYGVLDVMNDHRGVLAAYHYGDSYMMLKNARLRCTFAPEDSGGICGSRLAVLDHYAHVLLEYEDHELLEVARVASAPEGSEERIGNSMLISDYKEAQLHGDIDLKRHVKRLVVNERHHTAEADFGEARVRALCHRHGWELVWMDDERARRLMEERRAVNPRGFKVNWTKGEVVACTEMPVMLPGDAAPPLDPRAAPAPHSMKKGTTEPPKLPVWLSDLSGRAVKHGLGALSKAKRDRLHSEWAGVAK